MSEHGRIVDSLVADLQPVRPLPRLRVAFAVALAALVVGLALWLSLSGLRPDFKAAVSAQGAYLAIAVALAATVPAALAAGLAAMRPGRESDASLAVAVGLSLLLSGAVGVWIAAPAGSVGVPDAMDLMCLRKAVLFGLAPAGLFAWAVTRGWAARPGLASAGVVLASGSFGALIVHLQCSLETPQHLISGHAAGPFVALALLAAPLAIALRRLRG